MSLLAIGTFAAVADPQGPSWTFDKDQPPLGYHVRLLHEEGKADVILLEVALRATLKAVSAEGDATFELGWTGVKVTRTLAGKKHLYDSAKPGAAPSPEVRGFAEVAGKTATVTVSNTGQVKSVEGAPPGVPGPGDFLAEGADRNRMIADALLGEIVVRLFRLPGTKCTSYGVICALGNAVAGCHLSEQTKVTQETPAKMPGGGYVNRVWTTKLESDGGSIRAGGVTLALTGGQAGAGRGTGVYGPACLVSLDESVAYDMPTASGPAKFKRALKIARS
jgi:hypothetical protein